jgi:RNA polymerase sigma factor (sigma-70 family)
MTFDGGPSASEDEPPCGSTVSSRRGLRKYQHLRNRKFDGVSNAVAKQLLRDNAGLVHFVAKRFNIAQWGHTPIGEDDLIAIGQIVLVQAWVDYDPERGTTFASWAVRLMQRAFTQLRRESWGISRSEAAVPLADRAAAVAKHVSGDAEAFFGNAVGGTPPTIFDTIADEDACIDDEELDRARKLAWFRETVRTHGILSDRERLVVIATFDDGRTLEDIGNALGVTRERVRQILAKATERLRRWAALGGMLDDE